MEGKNFTAITFHKSSKEGEPFSSFIINLSFEANSLQEAKRVAALNTDHSLVVLKKEMKPVSYHLKLSEKRALWQSKVLFQKLYSSAS